ncbi:ABC transporter substrate-binding protein [Aureimonas sp. Leaf454]|uniref:ABC transporter substrate-binding protein n=1 Tax=Aureimonas sp. Leaf454 TaxID=1736381 RepID=UPI0006FD8211|nr:ABC transporter substrate-binding protein [Aureimonas sp. Leaf454]KQT54290.1 ABC transporter substrate-binding protein [Aureimonas sp. Leaf454]
MIARIRSAAAIAAFVAAASLLSMSVCVAAGGDRIFDIVAPFEIGDADPSLFGFVFQRMEVGETLLEVAPDGQPRPGLATSWDISRDGLTWTLPIRDGVRFHDGSRLTAALAAASLERARARSGALNRAGIRSIRAESGAVVIRLERSFAPLWSLLAHYSTIVVAPSSFAANGAVRDIVGTGPYRVTRMDVPRRLEVEAFADYWGDKPAIGAATYLAASPGEARTRMVESGEADMAFTLDPTSIARLRATGSATVLQAPSPRVLQIKVNAAVAPFDTRAGRTALSQAIQREGITRAIIRVPGTSATQLFPPSLAAWYDPRLPPLTTDPDAAKAGFAQLGWVAGDDGILQKDGKPMRLTLLTYADRPELPLVASVIGDQLRQIGVSVDVVVTDAAAIPAGHADGTLRLALVTRNYALFPDPLVTLLGDFASGGSDWGPMNWVDPEFETAMSSLSVATDPVEAARLRRDITGVLQRELPVVPVAWYEQAIAVTKSVDGAVVDPLERTFGLSRMKWTF